MNWNFQIKHSKRSNRNANTLRVARPWAARTQPLLAMCAQPMRSSHSCCIPIASLRTHWCSLRAPALIARELSLAVRARDIARWARDIARWARDIARWAGDIARWARDIARWAGDIARCAREQCWAQRSWHASLRSLRARLRALVRGSARCGAARLLPTRDCLGSPFAHAHSSIARGTRHKAGLLPCARALRPCSLHSCRTGDELPCSSSHARTIQHPLRVTRSVHCFVRASYMNESHKNLKFIFKINDKLINNINFIILGRKIENLLFNWFPINMDSSLGHKNLKFIINLQFLWWFLIIGF